MLLLAGSLAGVDGPSSLVVLPSTHGLEGAIWMMGQSAQRVEAATNGLQLSDPLVETSFNVTEEHIEV